MDRLKREGNPPAGQLASPVPQYKDTVLNDWAEVKGEGGASYVKDKDALAELANVKSELEAVKAELATIKANQTSGNQKVKDEASSSGLSANRPQANQVRAGFVYYSVDTDELAYSDGASWVVM